MRGQTLSVDTNGPFYAKLFLFWKGPCLTGGVIHKNHYITQTLFMRGCIPVVAQTLGTHGGVGSSPQCAPTTSSRPCIQTMAACHWCPANANLMTPVIPGTSTFLQLLLVTLGTSSLFSANGAAHGQHGQWGSKPLRGQHKSRYCLLLRRHLLQK